MNTERLTVLAKLLESANSNGVICIPLPNGTEALPSKFDMEYWAEHNLIKYRDVCGTASCIGGTANLLWSQDRSSFGIESIGNARELLGLERRVADDLFYPWKLWAYLDAEPEARSPKAAAKVIRHLIATGEVDWAVAGMEPYLK